MLVMPMGAEVFGTLTVFPVYYGHSIALISRGGGGGRGFVGINASTKIGES